MSTRSSSDPALETVEGLLRSLDVDEDDLAGARRRGTLPALLLDRLLLPAGKRYTEEEVTSRAGVDPAWAETLWRALGLPETAEGERIFTREDARVLQAVEGLVRIGRELAPNLDVDALTIQITRVLGIAMARLASTEVEVLRRGLAAATASDDQGTGTLEALRSYYQGMGPMLDYVHRRHLVSATMRELSQGEITGDTTELAIGFADMVGFTALSQLLETDELARLVTTFTERAYSLVAENDGRVVKTIGDEVMFAARDPAAAARIALGIAEPPAGEEDPPEVRVGLSYGQALRHEGDLFGSTVNLASRLVGIARPGTVLVSLDLAEALGESDDFHFVRIRPQSFKGMGRQEVRVLRAGPPRKQG